VISYGTQAASRDGWAMTGQVTLSGKINAVGKVRAKVGVRGAQHTYTVARCRLGPVYHGVYLYSIVFFSGHRGVWLC
jgi:hypothetical protein